MKANSLAFEQPIIYYKFIRSDAYKLCWINHDWLQQTSNEKSFVLIYITAPYATDAS